MIDANSSYPDLSFLPDLPKGYFWQRTRSGASLMRDRRAYGEGRIYLGHFLTEALMIYFQGRNVEEFDLSILKRERVNRALDRLRQAMSKIHGQ